MACSTRNTSPRTSAFKSICRTPALKTSTSSFIGRRVKTMRRSTSTERAPAVVQHRMLDDGVFLYSSKSSPKELRLASTERRRASSASERSDSTSRSAGERPPAVDARRSRMCSSDRSNVWSVAARFVAARFTGASLRSPSTAARSLLAGSSSSSPARSQPPILDEELWSCSTVALPNGSRWKAS